MIANKSARALAKPASMILTLTAAALALSCALVVTGCTNQGTNQIKNATPTFSGQDVTDKPENKSNTSAQQAVQAAVASSQSDKMKAAEAAVTGIVADYGSSVAVAVVPTDGSQGFSVNGNEKFVSASMIKLLILAEYMSQCDAGTINGGASYVVQSDDIVGGTGSIQGMGAGTTLTYDELAEYMINCSDNTATNILIDTMGMSAINARAAALGLSQTDLQRKMMQLNSGVENHISANDAATILMGIDKHTIASDAACTKAEVYLLEQKDGNGIISGLPGGVKFGHKTGDLNTIRHDGGIVYGEPTSYVIVVLTDLGASQGNAIMASVSSAVYGNLNG